MNLSRVDFLLSNGSFLGLLCIEPYLDSRFYKILWNASNDEWTNEKTKVYGKSWSSKRYKLSSMDLNWNISENYRISTLRLHTALEKLHLFIGSTDAELLGKVVHKIFYQNKDLSLLLVLLASSSGIANAFLVMVLFDEDFR